MIGGMGERDGLMYVEREIVRDWMEGVGVMRMGWGNMGKGRMGCGGSGVGEGRDEEGVVV